MIHKPKHVSKVWGYELWFHNDKDYCGKVLHVDKQHFLSYHYHPKKKETFYLQSGKILVIKSPPEGTEGQWLEEMYNAPVYLMLPGDAIEIPTGWRHAVIALEDSDIFETSTEHFDDDSIRITPSQKLEYDDFLYWRLRVDDASR